MWRQRVRERKDDRSGLAAVRARPRATAGGGRRVRTPITDLRWWIQDGWVDWWPGIWLAFGHPSRVNGCGDTYFETRIPPGGAVVQRVRWDGQTNGAFGPPPSGPARVTGTFAYRLPGGERLRSIQVTLDTRVTKGRDPDWLHPMEAVDAALADPRFQALMEEVSLGYDSVSYVAFDPEREVWVVGACGSFDGQRVHWRAAPVSGAVTRLIDGPGAESCEQGPLRNEPNEGT